MRKPSSFSQRFYKMPLRHFGGVWGCSPTSISEIYFRNSTYVHSPVSSEMGECVHKCVACYSEKRGFFRRSFAGNGVPARMRRIKPVSADTGIKFSGKYVWRCWNLVETLRQICYTFKRQYHNGRRLALHGGTVTLRSHRDLYGVQKYMDKGGRYE